MSLEEREGTLDRVSENGILLGGERLNYSKWFDGERLTEESLGRTVRVKVDVGTKCSFLKKILRIGDKTPSWTPPPASSRATASGTGGTAPDRLPLHGFPGRRLSPEELDLKRDEGIRIARSVAVDRAITIAREGLTMEAVAPLARWIEQYLLTGKFPSKEGDASEEIAGPVHPAQAPTLEPSIGKPCIGEAGPVEELPSTATATATAKPVAAAVQEALTSSSAKKPSRSPAPVRRTRRPDPKAVNALFNEAKVAGLLADWNGYLEYCQRLLDAPMKSPYALDAEDFARIEAGLRGRLGEARPSQEKAA